MPSVDIVPMTLEDLSEVLSIEEASFPRPFSRKLFETELQLAIAHLYSAKQEGRLVGYIDFWDSGREIHLINVAVDPNKRHLGVGTRLMEALIDYAKPESGKHKRTKEIYLDVRVSNRPAIALYTKFGFKEVSIRKGYYQDNNEDALLMTLVLPVPPSDKSGRTPGVIEKEGTKTNGSGPESK